MNINVNDMDPLNIKLINGFTCGHTWNIVVRNAVLLVMSPFNVPIACVQINIDKTLLSIVNTARRKGIDKLGFKWVYRDPKGRRTGVSNGSREGEVEISSHCPILLPLSYINLSLRWSGNYRDENSSSNYPQHRLISQVDESL